MFTLKSSAAEQVRHLQGWFTRNGFLVYFKICFYLVAQRGGGIATCFLFLRLQIRKQR